MHKQDGRNSSESEADRIVVVKAEAVDLTVEDVTEEVSTSADVDKTETVAKEENNEESTTLMNIQKVNLKILQI